MTPEENDKHSSLFKILPAVPEDAEAIYHLQVKTNLSSSLQQIVRPPEKAHLTTPEEYDAWRIPRTRKILQSEDVVYLKAVLTEEPDKFIGYAAWFKPDHFKAQTLQSSFGRSDMGQTTETESAVDTESDDQHQASSVSKEQNEGFPACLDVDAQKQFLTKMDEERKAIWGENTDYWYLGALGVDPSYQRMGIGTKLVKIGLELADEEDVPAYLEASPEGALMYPTLGFKKISEFTFFDGRHTMEFHIRPVPKDR